MPVRSVRNAGPRVKRVEAVDQATSVPRSAIAARAGSAAGTRHETLTRCPREHFTARLRGRRARPARAALSELLLWRWAVLRVGLAAAGRSRGDSSGVRSAGTSGTGWELPAAAFTHPSSCSSPRGWIRSSPSCAFPRRLGRKCSPCSSPARLGCL